MLTVEKGKSGKATLKSVKKGTATVTAKIKNGKKLKCKVTVKDPLTLSVSKIEEDYTYNDLYVKFTNNSKKKIVYVKFDITQYNNREDKLKSPYSFYYLNEDLAPRSYDTYKYWVHDDTKSADLTIKEVTFSDGTKWKP